MISLSFSVPVAAAGLLIAPTEADGFLTAFGEAIANPEAEVVPSGDGFNGLDNTAEGASEKTHTENACLDPGAEKEPGGDESGKNESGENPNLKETSPNPSLSDIRVSEMELETRLPGPNPRGHKLEEAIPNEIASSRQEAPCTSRSAVVLGPQDPVLGETVATQPPVPKESDIADQEESQTLAPKRVRLTVGEHTNKPVSLIVTVSRDHVHVAAELTTRADAVCLLSSTDELAAALRKRGFSKLSLAAHTARSSTDLPTMEENELPERVGHRLVVTA